VSITVDRYLTVKLRTWKVVYFRGRRVLLYSFVLLLFFALFNSNMLIWNGFILYENGTEQLQCFATGVNDTFWYQTWGKVA
jgi:hypothetical protein